MRRISKLALIITIFICIITVLLANDEFEKWKTQQTKDFESYRTKQDEQFLGFLKNNWEQFELSKVPQKDEKPKPEMIPVAESKKLVNIKDNSVMIKEIKVPEIIIPKKEIEDKPVEELGIEKVDQDHFMEVYQPEEENLKDMETIAFDFWGLPLEFKMEKIPAISVIKPVDKKAIADFWFKTGDYNFEPLVDQLDDCKSRLKLNDWDYCKLINTFSRELSANDAVLNRLYEWFFLVKSGFDVKVGYNQETVNLLIPTNKTVYGTTYLTIDERKYYIISFDNAPKIQGGIYTYDKKYPDSNDLLNLEINTLPEIPESNIAKDFKFKYGREEFVVSLTFDQTTAQFFEDFPQTELSVYFKAPISEEMEYSLAKQFKPILEGRNQQEAVSILLRFVQTAFQYKTDNDQFGREKALLAMETIYYPYSDCEDRSVIFSYLVRSLLGMEVIVLDYPGHIATAVKFDGDVDGDVIQFENQRYIICDPTYINAEIGMSMPKFRKVNPEIFTF